MDLIINFLRGHSSASLSVISNRLEISVKELQPLLASALNELGINNFRIIYTIYTGIQIFICTEKNKKDIEDKYGLKARIYAVQRITEDIASFYHTEFQEREDIITEENKNGGFFLPVYSNTGGFKQDKREYSNQKKLNFKPKKTKQEIMMEEIKERVEEVPKPNTFELEEEGVVRYPASKKVSFKNIIDLEVDDMADIMMEKIEDDVKFVAEKQKIKPIEIQQEVIEPVKIPTKRTAEVIEPKMKRQFQDSIIPTTSKTRIPKLSQPSLATFFQKNH